MPRFKELEVGEAFALRNGTSPAWRTILRKIGTHTAQDDGGALFEIESQQGVDRLEQVSVSHALWVQVDGPEEEEAWRLILRWNQAGRQPRSLSVDASSWSGETLSPEEDDDREARSLLASALQAQGQAAQALALYDELLEEQEDPSLLNNRGAVRASLGDLEQAIGDYTRALELDPRLAQAYSNRGNARTKRGDYERAIEDYDRALALAGDAAAIYCNRGLTRKLLGDVAGGVEDFERAIACDEDYGPSYLARGGVRATRGDLDGAVRDLERFLELAPEAGQADQVRSALRRLRSARGGA